MISVIVYGRNDSHGYNLPKRAAISLNCIAEMLEDEDDEIIFVDYNTPNDLPTFVEAIYDTLTARTKRLLRVFRIRPELHAPLRKRTHLVALEPHSRNIAIRRSNPANRWILFTNTDMVFLPRPGFTNFRSAVADLPDGQYILPRFELPESLWELFPRQDPDAIMRSCEELGTALHLNEVAISHPYMRFDSPGDFQMAPRKTLFDICGFDERMIYGWHADSNMCKRLCLLFGQTESLADRLKGYHCDHTRVATLAHRLDIKLENDLYEFVYNVTDPYARHQESTWGMPEQTIEEIDFRTGPMARYVPALQQTLRTPQTADYQSDANDLRHFVAYHSEHVLPYIAANLTVYPATSRLLYVGNNVHLLRLLAECVAAMGFQHPIRYLRSVMSQPPETDPAGSVAMQAIDPGAAQKMIVDFDVLVFDFGLDSKAIPDLRPERVTDWPRPVRYALGAVARWLERCAVACEEGPRTGKTPPDFIALNANHYIFDQFIGQFLIATHTPYNTHVRKGRARRGDERLYRSNHWKWTEEAMRASFGYDVEDTSIPVIASGQSLDLTNAAGGGRYKDGSWGAIDFNGTWTDGYRADLIFRVDPALTGDLVAYIEVTETFLREKGEPLRVTARLNGYEVGRFKFLSRYNRSVFRVILPRDRLSPEVSSLSFAIENPLAPALLAREKGELMIGEDPRELGIKVKSITFGDTNQLFYSLGTIVDFLGGREVYYTDECWTKPDSYGTWTLGSDASLLMYVSEIPDSAVIAEFTLTDAAVNEEHPNVNVNVAFNGTEVAQWELGPNRTVQTKRILLPPEVFTPKHPVRISFHIDTPRTPAELKWSEDRSPLGFRLTRLQMRVAEIPTYKLGNAIDFTEGGNADAFLDHHWTTADGYGSWTLGPSASMSLRLTDQPTTSIPAKFLISDCMVSDAAPSLPVQVKVNGNTADQWTLGPGRVPHERTVAISPDWVGPDRQVKISFEIPTPRTPASLGWSPDFRPLGIRLTSALLGAGELAAFRVKRRAESTRTRLRRLAWNMMPPSIKGWTFGNLSRRGAQS